MAKGFALKVNGKEVFSTKERIDALHVSTHRGEAAAVKLSDFPYDHDVDIKLVYAGFHNARLEDVEEDARELNRERTKKREKSLGKAAKDADAPVTSGTGFTLSGQNKSDKTGEENKKSEGGADNK